MLKCTWKMWTGDKTELCKVRALDEDMNEFEMEGEGLLARAFCHEIDHLDGKCM